MEIIQEVIDGQANALEVYIELKRSEKEIKNALNKIKDLAIEEAEKHGEKVFDYHGVEITMKSGGGRWEYKHLDWWSDYHTSIMESLLADSL